MHVTHLELRNWRNFKHVDIDVGPRLFVFGPNASGKSNLLDALRFLRDLTLDGGGLQKAVHDRGDVKRLRNLAARNFNRGLVTISIALGVDPLSPIWEYELTFTAEKLGKRRAIVVREVVKSQGVVVLARPESDDGQDPERLTQTAIEQVGENRAFREVGEFLASVRYLHLVPQVIRDPDRGTDMAEDPFGGDFLARVARTPERDRQRRMRVINKALQLAVPQLEQLALGWDDDKRPHLEARYNHWRVTKALQNEADFSDGTLGNFHSLSSRSNARGHLCS